MVIHFVKPTYSSGRWSQTRCAAFPAEVRLSIDGSVATPSLLCAGDRDVAEVLPVWFELIRYS